MSTCPDCGSQQPDGAERCSNCGGSLAADIPELLQAGIVCPRCDTYNELSARVCIRCGETLAGPATPATAASPTLETTAVGPTPAPKTTAQPAAPAEKPPAAPRRPTDSMPALTTPASPPRSCSFCGARLDATAATCPTCGRTVAAAAAPSIQPAEASLRLRLIRGFGQEDTTWPIGPAGVTVGRVGATITIAEDPYLAPVHFRLANRDGQLVVQDFGGRNGTFVRARGKAALHQGSEFIAGRQRLAVLGLGGPTTDVRLPGTGETRLFGSPAVNQLFVALRSLHPGPDGTPRGAPVVLRAGPLVTLGREGCDLNFPDDGRLATRHAEIHLRASGIEVVATGATGVYLRIGKEQALQNGDEILAGEELFRVEID